MNHIAKVSLILLFSIVSINNALSAEYKIGSLIIEDVYARATLPKARVSGGYLTITNMGKNADTLAAISASFAGKAEVHEMKMNGDVMKMRKVEGGLKILSGQTVTLSPSGFHVMFMKLNDALKEGEQRNATLEFEKAGSIEVAFEIEGMKSIKERSMKTGSMDNNQMDKDKMKHGKMNHSK